MRLKDPADIEAAFDVVRFRLLLFWIFAFGVSNAILKSYPFSESRARWSWLQLAKLFAIALLVANATSGLVVGVMHLVHLDSFGYNEGWNAFHTARLLSGGHLYLPVRWGQVTPMTYPPVSFLLTAAIGYFAGNLITVGRMLSFLSLVGVAYLCYRITVDQGHKKMHGVIAALACLGFIAAYAPGYVATFDPDLLGRFLSLVALWMYVRWQRVLCPVRVVYVAGICALSLFIKQNLIAVPLTIAVAMLLDRSWRLFLVYASSGAAICSTFLVVFRMWFGPEFFQMLFGFNFVLFNRFASAATLMYALAVFSLTGGALFAFLVRFLLQNRTPLPSIVLTYTVIGFLVSSYVLRGSYGVSANAWFDVLIALSLGMGNVAAMADLKPARASAAWVAIIAATAAPLVITGPLWGSLYVEQYRSRELAFERATAILRQAAGPTLFEEPLIGFCAGKPFEFDTFLGSQLILGGVLPESELIQALRSRRYSAIQTDFDVEGAAAKLPVSSSAPAKSLAALVITERWTDNSVGAIAKHYRLQEKIAGRYFFYVPREEGPISTVMY